MDSKISRWANFKSAASDKMWLWTKRIEDKFEAPSLESGHHHGAGTPINHHPEAPVVVAIVDPESFVVHDIMRCPVDFAHTLLSQPMFVRVPEGEEVTPRKFVWNDELRAFAKLEDIKVAPLSDSQESQHEEN